MTTSTPRLFAAAMAALTLLACEQAKSSNPLSPLIAGPIAGVEITPPQPVQPAAGARIRTDAPALTLVVQNASTNGVRPVAYDYQIATDSSFTTLVYARAAVPAGSGGQTSLQVSEPLESNRTYVWRVRGNDGANASPFSGARVFEIVDPPQLFAPTPTSPTEGATNTSRQPTLRVNNAARTGDVGAVWYLFQVASDSSFQSLVEQGTVDEQPLATQHTLAETLAYSRTYYWRARAHEPTVTGPWSVTRSFTTQSAPVTNPGGPTLPPGTPCPLPSGSGVPNSNEGAALVACVKEDLVRRGFNLSGTCGAFEITLRVAWALRDRGAGLEVYSGTSCNGYSHDIVFFSPSAESADILIGAGSTNTPAWQYHGPEPSLLGNWRAPWNPDGEE